MAISDVDTFGKDVFLRLLTTQLAHQDPLSPMESTAFITQLAQFTQLENLTDINETLNALIKVNSSLNNYGVAGLIGREVQVDGEIFPHSEGLTHDLQYQLEGDAQEAIIQISDDNEQIVKVLRVGTQKAGPQTVLWDGRDQNGNSLPDGNYRFKVSATNINGEAVDSVSFSIGAVSGVVYENGLPFLIVNGNKVPASNVMAVNN